jgi:hypothetical protein
VTAVLAGAVDGATVSAVGTILLVAGTAVAVWAGLRSPRVQEVPA